MDVGCMVVRKGGKKKGVEKKAPFFVVTKTNVQRGGNSNGKQKKE